MPHDSQPLVSIIIPTRNEEEDIARTMDALVAFTYDPLEVVVVDASTDRTPEIVQSYANRLEQLKLVSQGDKPGVSVARNVGLKEATGEIVVILNADVFPYPDFIDRIMEHYRQGADFVLVNSEIVNEGLYPRYLQSRHLRFAADQAGEQNEAVEWTEGFSCRLEAALAVGGFPEEFGLNSAGEDAIFGNRLGERYKSVVDYSIVVPHVAPTSWQIYWPQRLGRGRGGAYRLHLHEGKPIRWARALLSTLGIWAQVYLIVPLAVYAWRLTPYSPRGILDWVPFMWAHGVDRVAVGAGYWQACREIARQQEKASR